MLAGESTNTSGARIGSKLWRACFSCEGNMGQETAETTTMSEEEVRAGKAALELLTPRYRAIADGDVQRPRTNIVRAAIAALGVATKINQKGWRPLFTKLPPERFSMETLDLLEPAARGAMYVCTQTAWTESRDTDAKLSVTLANEAVVVRDRMLKVVEYHLGQDPENGPEIAAIRSGKGYADLSQDLWRLSELYHENAEALSKDGTFYKADDAQNAERMAKVIQDSLGITTGPKDKAQLDLQMRAWTFLQDTYEKIAKPGRWLLGAEGEREFVSLLSAGRKPAVRKDKVRIISV
jgi:hypothetical protein